MIQGHRFLLSCSLSSILEFQVHFTYHKQTGGQRKAIEDHKQYVSMIQPRTGTGVKQGEKMNWMKIKSFSITVSQYQNQEMDPNKLYPDPAFLLYAGF